MIHRYAMLGILTEDGYPVANAGSWTFPRPSVRRAAAQSRRQEVSRNAATSALIKKDGASSARECGHTGACG